MYGQLCINYSMTEWIKKVVKLYSNERVCEALLKLFYVAFELVYMLTFSVR